MIHVTTHVTVVTQCSYSPPHPHWSQSVLGHLTNSCKRGRCLRAFSYLRCTQRVLWEWSKRGMSHATVPRGEAQIVPCWVPWIHIEYLLSFPFLSALFPTMLPPGLPGNELPCSHLVPYMVILISSKNCAVITHIFVPSNWAHDIICPEQECQEERSSFSTTTISVS